MSTITHKFSRAAATGRVGSVGSLICTPSVRRELPDETVLPESFVAPLESDGTISIELDDTIDDVWCWNIREDMPRGRSRWVVVNGDADYGDLVDVDPEDGTVIVPAVPIWKAYVDIAIANVMAVIATLTGRVTATEAALAAEATARTNGDATLTTALGSKADLVGGVVPTSQIPGIALTKGQAVASRAAMLALANVQEGDIVSITGTADKGTYMLGSGSPAVFASWLLLSAPTDVVTSVNGQQGTVVLAKGDVGLGNVDNTSDLNKPVSTAQGLLNVLYGAGSPEGVVTAGIGRFYSDTAKTLGVALWRKNTGSGNTGWVVVDGDTGRRNITALASNIDPANTGSLILSRRGETVILEFANLLLLQGSGGSLSLGAIIPTGFRVLGTRAHGLVSRQNSLPQVSEIVMHTNILYWICERLANVGGTVTVTRPNVGITGQLSWPGDPSWPTALPGVAA